MQFRCFIYLFILSGCISAALFIFCLFIYLFIQLFIIYLFIINYLINLLFIHYLFIYYLFIYLLFIYLLIHSFIYLFNLNAIPPHHWHCGERSMWPECFA